MASAETKLTPPAAPAPAAEQPPATPGRQRAPEEQAGQPQPRSAEDEETEEPRRLTSPRPVVGAITNASYNCPFRPSDTRVAEIWATARQTLQGQNARDQACKNALEPLQASLASTEAAAGLLSDPFAVQNSRLAELRARISILREYPDRETGGDSLVELQEQEARLMRQIEESRITRDNQTRDAAIQNVLGRVNSTLDSVQAVQRACTGADVGIAEAAGRSSLQLFAAASPLIFGPMSPVGTIADILSRVAGALTGPTASERGLRYMTEVEDLDNLACFYFHVQKQYCDGVRNDMGTSNMRRLVHVRRLFEDNGPPLRAPIGRRMRNLFNEIYGDDPRRQLNSYLGGSVPQFCGLMSAVPGESGRCTRANPSGLGQVNGSCNYIDYYQNGTSGGTREWPTAEPSGPLSTGAGAGGASR